jgi:peptidyl-prolyl cis-trans isomerase A (cyclophilin A)
MQRRHALALITLPLARPAAAQATPERIYTQVDTALGAFVIAVDPARAPVTVANYLAYVDAKQLDGGSVYRIVTPANQAPETRHKIAVVQWGRHQTDEQPAPRPPIVHETTQQTGLRHLDGTVSMARIAPGSATAEFFICVGDQPELDFGGGRNPDGQGFAAFGQVVAGQAVVQALYRQGQAEQFLKAPIAVRSVRRLSAEEAAALLARR